MVRTFCKNRKVVVLQQFFAYQKFLVLWYILDKNEAIFRNSTSAPCKTGMTCVHFMVIIDQFMVVTILWSFQSPLRICQKKTQIVHIRLSNLHNSAHLYQVRVPFFKKNLVHVIFAVQNPKPVDSERFFAISFVFEQMCVPFF